MSLYRTRIMTLIQIQAELTSFRRTSAECDSDSVPFHELESGSDLKALLHSYLFYEYTNFMLALPYEFIYLYNTLVNIHHRRGYVRQSIMEDCTTIP